MNEDRFKVSGSFCPHAPPLCGQFNRVSRTSDLVTTRDAATVARGADRDMDERKA